MPRPIPHFGWPTVSFELNRESPQARGLAGWWPTHGNRGALIREYVSRNYATFVGAPRWIANSRLGQGLDSDASFYATIAGTGRLNVTGNMTASFWIRTTSAVIQDNVFGFYNPVGPFNGFGFAISFLGVAGVLSYFSNAHGAWVSSVGTINDGVIHHCVVVVDAGRAYFYIDGVADSNWASAAPTAFTGGRALLARSDGASPLIGEAWDFRLYNLAKTAAEVWRMFTELWDLYKTPMVPRARSPLAFLAERGVLRGAWRGIMRGM